MNDQFKELLNDIIWKEDRDGNFYYDQANDVSMDDFKKLLCLYIELYIPHAKKTELLISCVCEGEYEEAVYDFLSDIRGDLKHIIDDAIISRDYNKYIARSNDYDDSIDHYPAFNNEISNYADIRGI
jgi:hypothetical protein